MHNYFDVRNHSLSGEGEFCAGLDSSIPVSVKEKAMFAWVFNLKND